MPHVVLNSNVNLDDIFNKFKGVLIRNEHSILKTDNIYISRDKTAIIIESLAIEVEKTQGVKKILAEIAKQLLGVFPELRIGETNLSDYLI